MHTQIPMRPAQGDFVSGLVTAQTASPSRISPKGFERVGVSLVGRRTQFFGAIVRVSIVGLARSMARQGELRLSETGGVLVPRTPVLELIIVHDF